MVTRLAKGTRVALASVILAYIYTNLDVMALHHRGLGYDSISLLYHFLYGWIETHFEGTYTHHYPPSDNIKTIYRLQEIPSMAYTSSLGVSTFSQESSYYTKERRVLEMAPIYLH